MKMESNDLLQSFMICGVLNRFHDVAEKAEGYFCNGITDCKPRDVAKKQLEDYKVKRWVSVDAIMALIDKERDEGNFVGGGFSAALCLSKIIKELEEVK